MKEKDPDPEYRAHSAMLWLAEIIEAETNLTWPIAKKLSERLLDEIAAIPELFQVR